MGYLKESRRGVLDFMGLFRAADAEGTIPPAEAAARADIFLAVNASSVELVDVERYCGEYVGARPLVLWNIELDTLRSDLGAPLQTDAERRCLCVHRRVMHSAEAALYSARQHRHPLCAAHKEAVQGNISAGVPVWTILDQLRVSVPDPS